MLMRDTLCDYDTVWYNVIMIKQGDYISFM